MPSQPHTCTDWACQASHTHAHERGAPAWALRVCVRNMHARGDVGACAGAWGHSRNRQYNTWCGKKSSLPP
eukprot:85802-Chlamydomonas_euryale.AAC.1